MDSAWTLGGLSFTELIRRTARESWNDAVFGQGGRMAFYHFLALFPSLVVLLTITAQIPHLGREIDASLQDMSAQILPTPASGLFRQIMLEFHGRVLSATEVFGVWAGAVWAALNGTYAMVYGLNVAYEVQEHRSWYKLGITICGLATCGSIIGCTALLFILSGTRIEAHFRASTLMLHSVQWIVLIALSLLWFAVLYRFAPNLRDHKWQWSTPGAICALLLWVTALLLARLYFEHVNDYSRSYGHLNSAVMLLLWLYVANGSILIGGEMNSEIQKATNARQGDRSGC